MPKSDLAKQMDEVQAALRPTLKNLGYRVRGRTFNRTTSDGLVQVVSFQMGSFDPPGTTYIPGLRENLYGRFTVNLGVYVPEVALYRFGDTEKAFIQEYDCCIRTRLGRDEEAEQEFWWMVQADPQVVADVRELLNGHAFPFLEKFETREKILNELRHQTENMFVEPPRIVCAIVLAGRGETDEARSLLRAQSAEPGNPTHSEYVQALAHKLGLGELEAS